MGRRFDNASLGLADSGLVACSIESTEDAFCLFDRTCRSVWSKEYPLAIVRAFPSPHLKRRFP
jgi:hypothetical protein